MLQISLPSFCTDFLQLVPQGHECIKDRIMLHIIGIFFFPEIDIYLSAAPVHEEVEVQIMWQGEALVLIKNPKRRRQLLAGINQCMSFLCPIASVSFFSFTVLFYSVTTFNSGYTKLLTARQQEGRDQIN